MATRRVNRCAELGPSGRAQRSEQLINSELKLTFLKNNYRVKHTVDIGGRYIRKTVLFYYI